MKETKIPQCLLLIDWENPNYSLTLIWNEMKTHLVLVTHRKLNSNKHSHRDKSMFFLPFKAVCLKQAVILLKPEIINGYECLLLIVTIFISSVLCFRVLWWSPSFLLAQILLFSNEKKLSMKKVLELSNLMDDPWELLPYPGTVWILEVLFWFKLRCHSVAHTVLQFMVILLPSLQSAGIACMSHDLSDQYVYWISSLTSVYSFEA